MSLTVHSTIRASVSSSGVPGSGSSFFPTISADGRYVAFWSTAPNLVAGDTNGIEDVFVRDLQTGATTRVSISSAGIQGNNFSSSAMISADGGSVAFFSLASNLVVGDVNGTNDIFVRDLQAGTTTLVSVSSAGTQGNGWSSDPSISASGRYVAFVSHASNLVLGDTNGTHDIFVRDRQAGTTTLVSVSNAGTPGDSFSGAPSISADGRHVAFVSSASNLVPGDTNGTQDIFVRDLQAGTTTLVSVSNAGTQGNGISTMPNISRDGRYVAFESSASNLVPGDDNGRRDIFVRDLQAGTTTLVSVSRDGTPGNSPSQTPSISADGRYVVFQSAASNLVAGDTNDAHDIFLRDLQTGTTTRVSLGSPGVQGNGASRDPRISADGGAVAFTSLASNLVADDTNSTPDIFVTTLSTPDTDPPSLSITTNDALVNRLETAQITLTASEAIAGLDAADLAVTGGSIGPLSTLDDVVFTTTFTPDADFAGPASISIAAGDYADLAGNPGAQASLDFTVDTFLPSLSLAVTPLTGAEASIGGYSVTVTRSGDISSTSSASWAVTGSGANPADAEDFQGGVLPSGTVTFAPGEASQTITVFLADDAVIEADEAFTVTLSDPVDAVLGTASAEGVITNDDAILSITADAPAVMEGQSGATAYTFTVTRSGDTSPEAYAFYQVTDGTAANGLDYSSWSSVVVFAPGQDTQTITVNILGDRIVEGDESFTVTLFDAVGATIGTASAQGVILNDDVLTFDIAADAPGLAEGDTGITPYTFTVTRSGDALGESTVAWMVQDDGSATPGVDFVSSTGLLTFGFGETTQTITVQVIGDGQVEADESFTLTLFDAVGAEIGTGSAQGVILNDDASILSIAADAPAVLEGNGGSTPYSFTVTRSGDTSGLATAFYSVQAGTASSADFFATPGVVVFNPGETTQTITVNIIGDMLVEADESFTVSLDFADGATLGTATAEGVIRNDDAATYSMSAAPAVVEGNDGLTPYVFTITRSAVADQAVLLDWFFVSPTVTSADVQLPAGPLVFGAYQDTATITVNIIGDRLVEGDESFTIGLIDPRVPTVILGTARATGVIEDDDFVLAPPSTPDLAAASDLGLSDSDDLTADLTPTLTGTAPIGSTVTLYEGGEVIGSGVALDGSWSITTLPLGAGPRSITATATLGGLTSEASAPLLITLDATAPTLTIAVDDPVLNGAETGTLTFTASEAITGLTAEDLVVIGGTLGALSTSDNITFTASFTPTAGFAGPAGISIAAGRYADAAGNAGEADSLGFAVDTLAPASPVIGAISTDTDTPGDFITSDRTLRFSGTAEAGSTVTLTLGGATLGSVLAVGGAWSFDHSATTLPLGDFLLTAQATDAAGNVSGLDSQLIRIFGGAVVTPCLTSWGQHYTGSIGNDSFCISGSDNSVTSGDGDDLIRMRGWRNVIDAGAGNDTIEAGQGRARVDAGSGDNVIRLEGWDNIVTAGPGDNHVSGAQGRSRVTLGDGDSTVQITGWDNRIEAGLGRLTVSGPQGEAVVISAGGSTAITLGGWRNEVRVGLGESHVIDAGRGQAKVTVAGGDATITARGTGNEIRTGDGDDIISGLEGAGFVWAGDGDNRVSATGWWNRIETGAGDDQITAGAGGAQVRAGAGDDVVRLAGWHNRVDAGAGDDTIFGGEGGEVFVLNAAGEGVDQIFDFGAAQGDKLELRGVARHQLQVEEVGQDLSVQVGGTEVAVLMGQGDLTLEELLAQGSLVFL